MRRILEGNDGVFDHTQTKKSVEILWQRMFRQVINANNEHKKIINKKAHGGKMFTSKTQKMGDGNNNINTVLPGNYDKKEE